MQLLSLLAFFFMFTAPLLADDGDAEPPAQTPGGQEEKKADAKDETGGEKKLDIRSPGPDMANYPNSAFTLPQGGFYAEITPAMYTAKYPLNPDQFNSEWYLRYGLFDRVELRLYSQGLTVQGGNSPAVGFGPLVFDTKIHLWDEWEEYYLPALGFEAILQTTWLASPAFNSGTEPAFSFNFDQTLPFDVAFEYNLGAQRFQDQLNLDHNVWGLAFSWAFQHDIVEDLAFFINGYYNATTLPRSPKKIKVPEIVCSPDHQADGIDKCKLENHIVQRVVGGKSDIPNVVGAGFIWTLNDNIALYCNFGAGTNSSSPPYQFYAGFGWTP